MKHKRVENNITIEGARIGFRNFSGKEGQYNPAGRRNFCVFLDPDHGRKLEADGWNIRWLTPRDEGDEPQACLQVSVNFSNIPPKIVLITSGGKTTILEKDVSQLDFAEIQECDIIIRPYNWEVNGKSGVKAYLKTLYVTIAEDEFERKYYNTPDSALNSQAEELPFD